MTVPYRFAVCSELFQGIPFDQACKQISSLGYDGVEIVPFTLGEDPAELSPEERDGIRRIVAGAGLAFVGLHWLLATLTELDYSNWVSVEVFDFSRDRLEIAKRAIDRLKAALRANTPSVQTI
jgi:sugar phosphate isomerase/epimerase